MRPSTAVRTVLRRPGQDGSLAALAALRAAAYELLGALLAPPSRGDLADLAAVVSSSLRSPVASELAVSPSLQALVHLLAAVDDERFEELEKEYAGLFLSGAASGCVPYESAYVAPSGRERGLVAVDVERAYADAGVSLADHGELPDHAAIELAFLSLLCRDEEGSWRRAEAGQAVACLRRQEQFHDRHLGRWLPAFCSRLAGAAAAGSVYRAVAETAGGFLAHDRELVRALVRDRSDALALLRGSRP